MLGFLLLLACTPKVGTEISKAPTPPKTPATPEPPTVRGNGQAMVKPDAGLHLSNMDLTISPKTDFYNFVNGSWMKHTEIPSDEGRWGSFGELREKNDEMTLALVDKALAMKSVDPNSDEGKIVTFFKTAMDMDRRNIQGTKVIQPALDDLAAVQNKDQLLDFMIKTAPYGGTLFGVFVSADAKNSNVNTLYLGGGNLGLPERDYYLNDDEDSKKKRVQYVDFMTSMLQFLGDTKSQANDQAKRILAFETSMAESMLAKEERRNPLNTYHPKSLAELNTLAPAVDWNRFLNGVKAVGYKEIIVSQPKYIEKVNDIWANGDLSTIKEYIRMTILNDAASMMSEEIDQVNFEFYGKQLGGTETQKPLNERILSVTSGVLGEALGKLYVKEYFPPEAKQIASDMVSEIRTSFGERIKNLDWMSTETKEKALQKLSTFTVKIGYPDTWKDYSELKVSGWDDGGSFYQNILNARKWGYEKRIAKIGKEVDKTEWFMPPQTVNAYYNPRYNEIVFPAAILQAPFFDFKADPACNFGGIGGVIGHEISHGFDDSGSRFDADGNLNNWWTDADREAFDARSKKLIDQYSSYEALPGIFVNGEFTLGENIGDLGGVNVAYDGLQSYLKKNPDPGLIDGFTQEQRFFLNWATIWRTKFRDEALKNRIKTDPHSPGQYRAVGPIINMDKFYEAFDIKEGDAMYKDEADRIIIW
mgnify:CR=1 FL=1